MVPAFAGTKAYLLLRHRRADFGEHRRDVEHAVREAPLVVVPGRDLDERAVRRHAGERRVEDRAGGIVVEVRRDERLGVVLEDALEIAIAAGLHRLIHLVDVGRTLGHEREVNDRDVDGGDADRVAVELAIEMGQYETDRRGGAGFGRIMFSTAERARRRSLWNTSVRTWSLVNEWMVFIRPEATPMRSSS